ncbi:MAG: DUF86 domain-containing protein [Bacteroidota bacterium]
MSEKDRANLAALVESVEKIKTFIAAIGSADAFYQDEKTFDAVLMNFVIIGETAGKLTTVVKEKIKSFRNLVAHNYFGVDAEEVWQIIHRDLPDLLLYLKQK